jgi:energy-coupling factor transport system substrate-specific component
MNQRFSAREIALFSLWGALIFGAKMAMAGLPNIEPVSLLVMLLAVCYGWKGLISVYIYVCLEFAVWGLGLWSFCYLYVWLILFALARLLRKTRSALAWASLSGCFGLLFGGLCALVYWVAGGWAAAVSWWIAGLPMDLIHGVGNFVIALVAFCPLRRCVLRLNRWYGAGEISLSSEGE